MNPASHSSQLRQHAIAIWQAAVDAVRPRDLIPKVLDDPSIPIREAARRARRILVVGAGKAGAAMSEALESALPDCLSRMEGIVNVPAECVRPLQSIRLHAARPAGTNQPTAQGVIGTEQILDLVASAGPEDLGICLLSGGGSALLPAPVESVSLADKQQITQLLHECGATINEMNAVRKHLSRIKGGGLAQAFKGRALYSLIISDVIGDPLDVIASGPTAPDPTIFDDALAVLEKYRLLPRVPTSVLDLLKKGASGQVLETPKTLPNHVHNLVIANNDRALEAAEIQAENLGYRVLNLGSNIEGETREVAAAMAGTVRSILANGRPLTPPVCLLSGGETTVTLGQDLPASGVSHDPGYMTAGEPNCISAGQPGCVSAGSEPLGGRNQEFVLAAALTLGREGLSNVTVLSGGTDGEDGPTDAAGAVADAETLLKADQLGLLPSDFLLRHDAYHFFQATGDLLRTGLTETNVMDVRVILIRD
jgi:hydroxypyruvate reductase/glycerate 2-kinase